MALTTVTTPASVAPAYKPDALLYEFKEEFTISGASDVGGLTSLSIGLSGAGAVAVGD